MANKNLTADLHDTEKDEAKLQPEEVTIELPDVKDIPGQENIHVPDLSEMADTTISSDDEEGVGLFGEDEAEYSSERLPVGEEIDEENLIMMSDEEPGGSVEEEDDLELSEPGTDDDADVTEDEKIALERTEQMDSQDNENLFESELDNTDLDGEKLNESEDFSGDDLDIPGEEEDDDDEAIGEEDEENNAYSLGDNE